MTKADLVPCSVCAGLGGWNRNTGEAVSSFRCDSRDWQRCLNCRGERKIERPAPSGPFGRG